MNPVKALTEQFIRRSPIMLLGIGFSVSLFDFATLYTVAAHERVLHLPGGIGLFSNLGLFANLVVNAISLYIAKKYYDAVFSMRTSKALAIHSVGVERALSALSQQVRLRSPYSFMLYGFMLIGVLAWLSNVSGHVFGNPEVRWGHKVFDSVDHPLTFVANRLHNVYTWIIFMPFLAHVVVYASFQLRQAISVASREGALVYDVLNPDRRGGFRFVDEATVMFNVVAALAYVEVTLHIETFAKMNPEHLIAYIALTTILILVNRLFLGDIYTTVRTLRLKALNKLKDDAYTNKLSFDILRYCYEQRVGMLSIINASIKVIAILFPALVKSWPAIVELYNLKK